MKYTPQQFDAINHRDGNLLVLACAGSGKTEVISRPIAGLVDEGVARSEIIAFTFTDRAAEELKARIRGHLEQVRPDDPSIGDMYVGTIHSFCLQLLKELDASYRGFEVVDEARQAALILTHFHFFESSSTGIGLNTIRHKSRTGGYWDTVRTFISTLNAIHYKNIPVAAIADAKVRECVNRYRCIAHEAPNYFFDFNRIIDELLQCLKSSPSKQADVRSRFRYLVVDEYQDVDDKQEELIRLISDGGKRVKVTVVGDDDQAIYGWRGARIENILRFKERYLNVAEVKLTYNFRSTHAVVDVANAAIARIPASRRSVKSMEARYFDPESNTWPETLGESGDIQMRTFATESEEADWVANRIRQLRGTVVTEKDCAPRAIDYADMAVLLRSVRSSGRVFAESLISKGIPCVVKGTGGLFDHDEVNLIYATFCLLARAELITQGESGYHRLDERDTREFVRDTLRRLVGRGDMPNGNDASYLVWIAAKREELDRRNLEKSKRGRLARRIYPQDLFQEALSQLGSGEGSQPWRQNILFNLGRLSSLITNFESVHQWVTPKDLTALCMYLGGWAAGQVDEGGLSETGTPNAVQIVTVHGAKGLEWPVVFVPRVSTAIFPSSLRNRGAETFLNHDLYDPKEFAAGDDGERRLWYVAMTRCQKFLNVSSLERPRKKRFFRRIRG